jgi:hypothetical protein
MHRYLGLEYEHAPRKTINHWIVDKIYASFQAISFWEIKYFGAKRWHGFILDYKRETEVFELLPDRYTNAAHQNAFFMSFGKCVSNSGRM